MIPVRPGRILKRELVARGLSANRLALELKVPSGRITDILNGKRGVSPETALRLARFLGASARFWVNLGSAYGGQPERYRRHPVTRSTALAPQLLPANGSGAR